MAQQSGGASQTLRRLVDQARKEDEVCTATRLAHERADRFMSALAGDYPGFEAASRALFADDRAALDAATRAWPRDVRDHAAPAIPCFHGHMARIPLRPFPARVC